MSLRINIGEDWIKIIIIIQEEICRKRNKYTDKLDGDNGRK
jgi:hypothetical protein